MKICQITSEYPPKWGGVGVVAYYLSNWLARRGHEVHVVTRKQSIGYLNDNDNIHIHPVKWLKAPMFFTTSFGSNAVKWVKGSGIDFDVVHVHSNMTLLKRKHYDMISSPIVSTMHGTWVGERSQISIRDLPLDISAVNDLAILFLSPFFDRYEDLALKRSDGVMVISKAQCRALSEREVKKPCRRRVLIYPGIDTEEFKPENYDPSIKKKYGIDADDRMLISVGRWAARKGVRETVSAFEMMYRRRKDISLVLVGWGPLGSEIRRRARKKGLEKKIHLLES
ncbi:MAG: glycosyltransferase family 4 protein, partial [Thermoplasmatota archaeon]